MAIVNGAHLLLYTSNPEVDRAFFREVLEFKHVDVGHGWLIFRLPPAELACHPLGDGAGQQQHGGHAMLGAVLYLMCDNVRGTVAALAAKRVACTEIEEEPWGLRTTIRLPSGGEIGLYQPKHETALNL
jgi:hypothetical protein